MDRFDREILQVTKHLQGARQRLLIRYPFYGVLLMHMKFVLDKNCKTAYTDGVRVGFNPEFLSKLSDNELEFVLMHEVLHAALGHPFRTQADYELDIFDQACDIVVNSNILASFDGDTRRITVKGIGEAVHLAPNGEEGRKYTVEQVYAMLMKAAGKTTKTKQSKGKPTCGSKGGGENNSDSPHEDANDGNGEADGNGETGSQSPPSLEELIASIKARSATIAESLKKEGMADTLQEDTSQQEPAQVDDHTFWEGDDEDGSQSGQWNDRVMRATDMIMEKNDAHVGYGGLPLCAQRLLKELREPEVDWRSLLNTFVQEEINDYSFSPLDKRMDDSPFFLPDFNEKDESVKNVWFLIDTSGSIGDKQISAAYSEIISAMEAFNNKLEGLLSFTEVFVTEPIPFCDPEELLSIIPVGGGGNDFGEIFRYMQRNMMDNLPASIVILTDGYDTYPNEKEALDVPVLWLINNQEAPLPPWGKCARFKVNEETKG